MHFVLPVLALAVQTPAAANETLRGGIDAGRGTFVESVPGDSIPLPTPAVVETGPLGDRLISPASGDPFFLAFASGAYFPPADEVVDPLLASRLQSTFDDGRPHRETYAFAMLARRLTPARAAELEVIGCRILGSHPYSSLKLALPPTAVDSVASLDFVRWIGSPRDGQKVHPLLTERLESASSTETIDVVVSVFDSDLGASSVSFPVGKLHARSLGNEEPDPPEHDVPSRRVSNGWQQRALEALGLEITEYLEVTRSFRARMAPGVLEALVARDFVQFVELDLPGETSHDESMPMIQADVSRVSWNGGSNAAAVAGIADSGFFAHNALGGSWIGVDYTGQGPWSDPGGHGTHVSGTLLGNGSVRPSWKGVAPGLGGAANLRVIAARIFNNAGAFSTTTGQIMTDFNLARDDGAGNVTPKPHVINHSWGACTVNCVGGGPFGTFFGTEQAAREVDDAIYAHAQLHIFCAGNEGGNPAAGSGTIRLQGTSKNALTVGAVVDFADAVGDPGTVASFSSRGPCRDGRWKPNVCAPGDRIFSALANTATGYTNLSGTSMATPHVTGLAASMCDHYSWLRYAPARLSSILMASAITKDDAMLTFPTDQHLRDYGTGRVDAYTAHFAGPNFYWVNSGFDQGWLGWTYGEVVVPAGATRLVACMTYHEPSASAGAAFALVNDLDLWIDSPIGGIDPAGNTGEFFSHQSQLNNTEIRSLENPTAGTWRFKVYPTNVGLLANTHVGLTVFVVTGDTTPDGTLQLAASRTCVRPNEDVAITATVTNPSYVASAVFLDSTSAGDTLQASMATLKDGAVTNYLAGGNQHGGRDVLLGDIVGGDARSATWTTRWATEGVKIWQVEARSDNWIDELDSIDITIDGTPPMAVQNLHSTTHPINAWTNDPNIAYAWTAANDNLSGVAGYSTLTTGGLSMPPPLPSLGAVTSSAETLASGAWFYNVRAVDACGNWSALFATAGPYLIDMLPPSAPTGLSSSSHRVGVMSCDTVVTVDWIAATDTPSWVAGYVGVWDASPSTVPNGAANLPAGASSVSTNIGSSFQARWFHLRAIDAAGNGGPTAHFGPIFANSASVWAYCTAKTNSLGCMPAIGWANSPSVSAGNFQVRCVNVINNKNGLLFWGSTPSSAPFQGGIKCVASPTQRTFVQSSNGTPSGNNCSGSYAFDFTATYVGHQGLGPGDTVYAQWWMRDPASPSTTGLSNALRFTLCE